MTNNNIIQSNFPGLFKRKRLVSRHEIRGVLNRNDRGKTDKDSNKKTNNKLKKRPPPKIRLLLKRILTRTNLSKKGINTPSILCPLCALDEESVDHLFHSCSPLLQTILEHGKSIKWRKFLETAVGGLVWFIWKARNNVIFKGLRFSSSMVKDEFQATLFSWMKYKATCKFLSWQIWCTSPKS
ncbi:hypothetical protein OSB04_029850 [Centaurea solstitialis]|uniref:Reverse transcriptase zinc-binding domain-containing protein n=1 Tax=Centaurea solstitialis TaxID=347529 RepID=A0AA38SPZ3_9ASTR|nr:hypothetical protein OSB04_029850 [Centaurea solstitialis]